MAEENVRSRNGRPHTSPWTRAARGSRRRAIGSSPLEASRPTTRWPASHRAFAWRPFPQPRSRTTVDGANGAANSATSGPGRPRAAGAGGGGGGGPADPAAHENLRVLAPTQVELPPDLLHDRGEVPAAGGRGGGAPPPQAPVRPDGGH